jgi:hypothetical protein
MAIRVSAASAVSAPLMGISVVTYIASRKWLKACSTRMPWEADLSNVAVDR